MIVADLAHGGFWLNGVSDERWDHAELMRLRTIPVSAFEVINTIKAPLRLIGPQYGQALTRHSFRLEHVNRGNSEFSEDVYFYQSTDGGMSWSSKGWQPQWIRCDDTYHGSFDVTFTPSLAGTYIQRVRYGGVEVVEPPDMTMWGRKRDSARRSSVSEPWGGAKAVTFIGQSTPQASALIDRGTRPQGV